MTDLKQGGERTPVPKLVVGLFIVLIVSVILLVFLTGIQLPDSNEQQGSIPPLQIPQIQDTDEEITISAHQTTVYLPEDAMDLTGNFVILPRQPDLFHSHSRAMERFYRKSR